jgi:hypothetical protein
LKAKHRSRRHFPPVLCFWALAFELRRHKRHFYIARPVQAITNTRATVSHQTTALHCTGTSQGSWHIATIAMPGRGARTKYSCPARFLSGFLEWPVRRIGQAVSVNALHPNQRSETSPRARGAALQGKFHHRSIIQPRTHLASFCTSDRKTEACVSYTAICPIRSRGFLSDGTSPDHGPFLCRAMVRPGVFAERQPSKKG